MNHSIETFKTAFEAQISAKETELTNLTYLYLWNNKISEIERNQIKDARQGHGCI